MEILIVLFAILLLVGFTASSEWKKMRREISSLQKEHDSNRVNASKMTQVINNLFFSSHLNLADLSRLSREFFDDEDLIKYRWEETTIYKREEFFVEEQLGPSLLPLPRKDQIIDNDLYKLTQSINRSSVKEWKDERREEMQELMEARRIFFLKNFSRKMYEYKNKYNSGDALLTDNIQTIFIQRYSGLLKSE